MLTELRILVMFRLQSKNNYLITKITKKILQRQENDYKLPG